MSETIGFIGLGRLGFPVAANLLGAGHSLVVYNRTASKAEPLIAQGARQAARPADAAMAGGIVVTLVWDDAALESIVTSDGFLERLGAGGIHISMSTVSPETSKKLAAMHARYGSTLIEAPIFGGAEAAAGRQLSIPVAGPQAAKERVRPLLKDMGGAVIYDFGEEVGAANLVKLAGNFLIVSAVRSLKEALTMVENNGGDPGAVVDMLTGTLFSAPIYRSYGKMIVEKTDGAFDRSKIPLKDVGTFKQIAQRAGGPAPIASALHDLLSGSKQG